tara:strand:+ start:9730 stop:10032 length:303 start_codon:yes stop_codon:yes gene_type:complete
MKYFTKDLLIKANNESIRRGRNRNLVVSKIKKLPDDYKFPVLFEFIHNDVEMRTEVMLDKDTKVFLDISFKYYNELPKITPEDINNGVDLAKQFTSDTLH